MISAVADFGNRHRESFKLTLVWICRDLGALASLREIPDGFAHLAQRQRRPQRKQKNLLVIFRIRQRRFCLVYPIGIAV
jgi:hypothetical protein